MAKVDLLPFLSCLLLLLLLVIQVPADECFYPICNLRTAYFVRPIMETHFPIVVEDGAGDGAVEIDCVYLTRIAQTYCATLTNISSSSKSSMIVYIPTTRALVGIINVTVSYHVHDQATNTILSLMTTQRFYVATLDFVPVPGSLVNIRWPHFGTVTTTDTFMLQFAYINGIQTSAATNGGSDIEVEKLDFATVGVMEMALSSTSNIISSRPGSDVEPGSWFIRMTPKHRNGGSGYPAAGYIEFILNVTEIQRHRRITSWFEKEEKMTEEIHTTATSDRFVNRTHPLHICIWGSNHMDGQKSIWLQQVAHMDKTKLTFTWVMTTSEDVREGAGVRERLMQIPGTRVMDSPLASHPLKIEDFDEVPNDGGLPLSSTWLGDEKGLIEYIMARLKIANYQLENLTPNWCVQFLRVLVDFIKTEKCQLTVYGNNRGFSSDALLVHASRIAGVSTVGELLNLFTDSEAVPDIIVGPSHYAVEHHSIANLKDSSGRSPRIAVISPAVDLDRFVPADSVRERSNTDNGIITVAFMARLSIEKNPGIFLLAAHELIFSERCDFCRFLVIGDGDCRKDLEGLVNRLNIAWAVKFTGMLSGSTLIETLKTVDIVINPSLRAWSETFCITNIEVMAMKIPLVTFGVGGIGEYIDIDERATRSISKAETISLGYIVGDNVVLLLDASPQVIARAVNHLVQDPLLRQSLGRAGRKTVEKYFSVDRQLREYTNLYLSM